MVKKAGFIVFLMLATMTSFALPDTFLETSVSNATPYPLQQIIYTVKIYTREALVRVGMQPPTVEGTQLSQMGPVQQYQSTKIGKNYHVAKVDYLLFSKKSGQRVINPPVMNGLVQVDNDRYSAYNVRNVQATAEPTTLNVKPIPAAFTGDVWLPTQKLTITDDWSKDLAKVKVGESITRTVILHATGVMESQLPDLTFPDIPGVNIYPDKPEAKVTVTNNGIEATKVFKFAVVPTQAGTQKIPALNVPWWDTKNHLLQQATISAATLQVSGAAMPVQTTMPTQAAPLKFTDTPPSHSLWFWLGVGLFSLSGWCVAAWLWYQSLEKKPTAHSEPQSSNSALWRQLKAACNNNQPHDAYHYALQLAQKIFPERPLLNLNALAGVLSNQKFDVALTELNQANYNPQPSKPWNGKGFYNLCKTLFVPVKKPTKPKSNGLPELFE